jgi:hypothetical protein
MKKTLLSLALAGTLLLGTGCDERKPARIYTSSEGNSEITLKDYSHWYCLEIKTPESKRIIYAEDCCPTHKDPKVTTVIDYKANSTNKYYRYSEEGRAVLKNTKPEFDKYLEAMQQEKATNTPVELD